MSQLDWDRIKEIFHAVRELDAGVQDSRIDELCDGDATLAERVRALVSAEDEGASLLQAPALSRIDLSAFAGEEPSPGELEEGPGSRIGPYKLLQVIGEGGFGIVYMAEQDRPIRRRVALKVIKPGMDSKQVIARFESERQALAMMDHPNIAKVFDAGTTPRGRPYFAMELVRGIPITDYCDEHTLDPRERLALFSDVCSAVQHAHQCGIIHRDLKPSNVMVTLHDGRPVPKVIDFGVAKATQHRLTDTTLFTEYNQFIGTPAYMSPEQAAYEGLDVDPRSDVYSLGVLLYELLTGTTPHDSRAMKRAAYFEVLRILKEEEPPKPSTRVQTMGDASVTHAKHRGADPSALQKLLRGDLDWIVMKALEKDRRRRYASAAEVAADIQRYFESRPITARPPSRRYRARKFARRRRGPLSAAAVIALAVAGDTAYVGWQRSRMSASSVERAALGAQPTALVTSSDEHECFYTGVPSPDGTKIAYADYCVRGGLHLYDTESGETTSFGVGALHESFAWSPDGTRLATAPWIDWLPALQVVSARTGAVETPAALRDVPLAPSAWSPRGDRIAGVLHARDRSRSLVVVSVETGERFVLAENVIKGQSSLSFSPDGRFITFSDVGTDSEDLFVADLTTGERWPLVAGPETEGEALWSPDGRTVVFQNGSGVWALPVEAGRPSGEPYLVRRDTHAAIAWTEHGYYYWVQNSLARGRRVRVDPETGGASGSWDAFPLPGSHLRHLRLAWSPDGSTTAAAGSHDGLLYLTHGSTSTTISLGEELSPVKLWWSRDGREVLFSPSSTYLRDKSTRTVYGVDVTSGKVRALFPPVQAEAISHAHVSPDGERMVFFRPMNALVLAGVGETEGRILATENEYGQFANRNNQPQFSPDGSRIAYMRGPDGASTTLWVVGVDGRNETLLATARNDDVIMGMAWHPGGSHLAYTLWDGQGPRHLWVVSVGDGSKHQIGGLDAPLDHELLSWSPDGEWLLVRETVGRNELWVTRDILERDEEK